MDDVLPRLDPGVTLLQSPSYRSTALHRLVINELQERDGVVYWIDARNMADPTVLYRLAPYDRLLNGVRISRAFTAYQHHTLSRTVAREIDSRTEMIVAPNVASLYQDDDVPDYEHEELYTAALTILKGIADTFDVPVLTTTDVSGKSLPDAVADEAAVIDCQRTRMGLHFAAEDFETTVYVRDGYWQTTIPYWVELFGAVGEVQRPEVDAFDVGMEETLGGWV